MELSSPTWTDAELDECVLALCDEFPDSRMIACSRALESCRQMTRRGTTETLRTTMRGILLREAALHSTPSATSLQN